MSDGNPSDPNTTGPGSAAKPTLPRYLKWTVISAVAIGAAGFLYAMALPLFHPGPSYTSGSGPAGTSIVTNDPAAAKAAADDKASVPAPSLKGTGDMPPEGTFTGPDGKPVKLADYAGKVVILNFWATWCPPCRKEMPSLAKLATSLKGQPVQVIPLSIDNAKATDKAKAFIAENAPLQFFQDAGMTYPFKFSPPVEGYPTTFLIDKTGRIRSVAPQDREWDSPKVRKVIDKLIAE